MKLFELEIHWWLRRCESDDCGDGDVSPVSYANLTHSISLEQPDLLLSQKFCWSLLASRTYTTRIMDEYDNDNHDADENDDMSQEDASETAADNGNSRLAGENNSISTYHIIIIRFVFYFYSSIT